MKLATFRLRGEEPDAARIGIVISDKVFETKSRSTMEEVLGGRADLTEPVQAGESHPLAEVILCAPVRRPGKIVAAIVNTRGMLGGDLSLDRPRLDMKAPSTVIGPGEEIMAVRSGIRPEVELAAVIRRRLSHADPDEARGAIFGFTILNDVTSPRDSKDDAYEAFRRDPKSGEIRKVVLRGPLFRSKNHDTFCPTGPWVVTRDEIGDAGNLKMTTRFADLLVQSGSTSEYIFTPEKIGSYVSQFLTLEPGDLVSCGSVGWTPEALGELDPTEFVLPDVPGVLQLEVQGIGRLENPVVSRKAGES